MEAEWSHRHMLRELITVHSPVDAVVLAMLGLITFIDIIALVR